MGVLGSTMYLRESGDEYYKWLSDDISLHADYEYWHLLRTLHRKEFYCKNKRDLLLSDDGLYLRLMYKKAFKGYDIDSLPILPSCLEVLVGLALRLEVADLDVGHQEWFWIFMKNLGLIEFDDEHYYDKGGTDRVNYILSRWLQRDYKHDGTNGNIFTTKFGDAYNFRTLDWLGQGNLYIRENYGIGSEYDIYPRKASYEYVDMTND